MPSTGMLGQIIDPNNQPATSTTATETAAPAAVPAPAPSTVAPAAPAAPAVPTLPTMPKREIKPEESVAGQLQKLTSQASPTLKAAETRARQQAAGRGILSSTMAEQAGKQAVIETAAPIAAQEAQIASTAASQEYQAQVAEHERTLDQAFQTQNLEAGRIDQLKGQYRTDLRATNDLYDRMAADIQNMPGLSVAEKEQRLANNEQARVTASNTLNATYQAEPKWQDTWSVIPDTSQLEARETRQAEAAKMQPEIDAMQKQVNDFNATISAMPFYARQENKPTYYAMVAQLDALRKKQDNIRSGAV